MFHRLIKLPESHSFFLFGARGTGKSTHIIKHYSGEETLFIDLLKPEEEAALLKTPNLLVERIKGHGPKLRRVILDEVQKLPRLLDLVHQQIEESKRAGHPLQFILTGSSARKLRRGAANLLAGRAFLYHLYPLTHQELGSRFDLTQILQYGSLPAIFSYETATEKRLYLETYGRTYLKEEIWNEQIVRKLEPFAHFLEVAAQCNGKILNFSKIGRDVGINTKTIQSYYQILEDTLAGFMLPAYHRSVRKRQTTAPKFYFFDTGVKRALDGTLSVDLVPQTHAFGDAFEHFVILEILRLSDYRNNDYRFFYFRTHEDAEIDLVVERPGKASLLIEIKSSEHVDSAEIKPLERVAKDFDACECLCLSRDKISRKVGHTLILPWQEGLAHIGL